MAEDKASVQAVQISLPPNEILINVAQALNGHVSNLASHINVKTTCINAIDHVRSVIKNDDRPLTLQPVRTRRETQKLKELAQFGRDPNHFTGPLRIRNAIPASQLPTPRKSTAEERKILKENFPKDAVLKQPYIMTQASLEDTKLANIAGEIRLTAIDWEPSDPIVQITSDNCLWDTGAHYCCISADLVANIDPTFLAHKNHDEYRMESNLGVQVDAVFSLSNKLFQVSTIFLVLPSSAIPNGRTGVILGQHGFMDRMMVETIPRSILLKRGEEIEETVWGEIRIKAMLNLFDDLQEYS